ncbi:MAG: ImmA/IrrE family metallo-endopeptidase [Terracidiphilus sp.]
MPTRSETYFLGLFRSTTLRSAIEAAVQAELFAAGESAIPVDVYRVAASKNFSVVHDLEEPDCGEGQLVPIRGGYRVRLRASVSESRARFSLAHEIGHSYFYVNGGSRPRHAVGLLNSAERNAEERICNAFAGALLMPSAALRLTLQRSPARSPSSIIRVLQQAAASFRVSMSALLARMGSLELRWPPCLIVCSSVRPNIKTGLDPKLRIEFSVGLGAWANRRLWSGTPVAEVNLISARQLAERWEATTPLREAGQFVLVRSKLERDMIPTNQPELGVFMSANVMGLWKREMVQCVSSSTLYARDPYGKASSGYLVTVITPSEDEVQPPLFCSEQECLPF